MQELKESALYNEDLAPVSAEKRTWNKWNFAALWVGMCICIPSYMLAASLMEKGMYWWQALITIALGNSIVLIPMILNAHAGTKYGIPFPVFVRSSFGVLGANIPAMMRAFVACGWFGIQTWIGGAAIYSILILILKSLSIAPFWGEAPIAFLGINSVQLICFLIFWIMNMAVVVKGIDCIKWLENWSAPVLIILGLWLLFWAVGEAGGFGQVFSEETVGKVRASIPDYDFWKIFVPMLTGMVGFWATLSLNIPDFTRFARTQRDQVVGQIISLPTTMTLFSFIGIAVTGATVVLFNEPIWDPVVLLTKFESPAIAVLALFGLLIATLSTNIAANVVSPANDFSNLMPKRISFKMGGIITGVIGALIMPWRLMSDLGSYIFTWLIGYGALLGTISGVMLVDYYLIRRTHLDVDSLYQRDGEYAYGGSGFNVRALLALFIGVVPNIPGFLNAATNGSYEVAEIYKEIYTYAWFVGLFVAGLSYALIQMLFPAKREKDPFDLTQESITRTVRGVL